MAPCRPTLPPDLERFATEAVAAGRYRTFDDVVAAGISLLQRQEAARAELLASVVAAEAEGDRLGYVSIEAVEVEMREVITRAATRSV